MIFLIINFNSGCRSRLNPELESVVYIRISTEYLINIWLISMNAASYGNLI